MERATSPSAITSSRTWTGANNPLLNQQIAFRATSPSSATTTVTFSNNTVDGANTAFSYYPGYNNAGTLPVQWIGNSATNVEFGFDFDSSDTVNYLSGNTISGTGSAGVGLYLGFGTVVTGDNLQGANSISGFGVGIQDDIHCSVTLSGTSITNNVTGVQVAGASLSIQNDTISYNGDGISVDNSGLTLANATIENSDISHNSNDGIIVNGGTVTIDSNTINYNGGTAGIVVNSFSTIENNTISYNDKGIQVNVNNGNPAISGNYLNNNQDGIGLDGGATIQNNFISDNNFSGVLLEGFFPIGTATVFDNAFSGNGHFAIYNPVASLVVDASGNWFDSADLASISAVISGDVDYTPYLNQGTDTDLVTAGFQGDFSSITVHTAGDQVGTTARIQEGVNLAVSGGTVDVLDGT